MQSFFKSVINIGKSSKKPVDLVCLLAEHPEILVSIDKPSSCIHAESVVFWHELGVDFSSDWPRRERDTLLGYHLETSPYGYRSFPMHRPEFEQIGHCEVTRNWACDIADVHGFSASKARLQDFNSTDEMIEASAPSMISEITYEKLQENMAHSGIHIVHKTGTDFFVQYSWDDRFFLVNSDGSHHFAAAKYIASRLPCPVPLSGKLSTYSLNMPAINSLRRDFEMFIISGESTVWLGFQKAMEQFKATWLWHYLPRPYEKDKLLLLPRNEVHSMQVAEALHKAGATDLGAYLTDLASLQLSQRLCA